MTGAQDAALRSGLDELAADDVDANLSSQLEEFITHATDVELFRVNPIRYAEENGLAESAAIDLFLNATKAGLFQMEWNIVCVSCGNVFKSFRNLEKVDPHFHCTLCDMENQSRLDDVIHVVFTVHLAIRDIIFHHPETLALDQLLFDYHYSREARTQSGGTPTAEFLRDATVALQYLEPGEEIGVDIEHDEGSVLVRDWTTSIAFFVGKLEEKSDKSFTLTIDEDGLGHPDFATSKVPIETPLGTLLFPAVHNLGPCTLHLTCTNRSSRRSPIWVVQYGGAFTLDTLSEIEGSRPLSARQLLSTTTFRRLFRSEAPGESEGLSVTDLTYLFTDLKNSTSIYDEIGDASAYNLVRAHFEVVERAVTENQGAVVKTVGDAVMATFLRPVNAVSAALRMQDDLKRVDAGGSTRLELKVGVHRGHSIAVTLNERLDYFGQNVNIAARTQQSAGASEILITQDVLDAPGVIDLLTNSDLEPARTEMKGIAEEIPVFRVSGR